MNITTTETATHITYSMTITQFIEMTLYPAYGGTMTKNKYRQLIFNADYKNIFSHAIKEPKIKDKFVRFFKKHIDPTVNLDDYPFAQTISIIESMDGIGKLLNWYNLEELTAIWQYDMIESKQ